MQSFDIIYETCDYPDNPTRLTAGVTAPDRVTPDTGVLLCTHGWGGSRLRVQNIMEYAPDVLDVVCVGVEYRQSGFAFDPARGDGFDRPYDASFHQVFDVLNGLRKALSLYPMADRRRMFHYGSSQGGHIGLLSGIFAPSTFALLYAACPIVFLAPTYQVWADRTFADFELAARDALAMADRIRCPVHIDHGTADEIVPCDEHGRAMARKLESLGTPVTATWYEGGDHGLEPASTRLDAFKAAAGPLRTRRNDVDDDFAQQSVIEIPCADRILRIDWSRPMNDPELYQWLG